MPPRPRASGDLPCRGRRPEVTTEYLEGLDINHLVAQFTTYHDCCEDRVVNIHRIADEVDGAIVLSGQTFSLNDHVGQRTLEDGYLPAGTIIAGEVEDTVGGGVSQFTTTLYSAVFWGGYEDVEHKPHSYYCYPEGGGNAQLAKPRPQVPQQHRQRDPDRHHLHGHLDHRPDIRGERRSDPERGAVGWPEPGLGGHRRRPQRLACQGLVSDRFALTDPPEPRYEPNPDFGVNQQDQTQTELGGWSVTVTRRICSVATRTVVEEQEWTVRYAPRFAVYEVHPCMVPGTSALPHHDNRPTDHRCPDHAAPTTTAPPPTTTGLTAPRRHPDAGREPS